MSDEPHQVRAAANEARRLREAERLSDGHGEREGQAGAIDPKAGDGTRRNRFLFGAVAAVALAAVGATLLASKTATPPGGMGFVVIDDPKEVLAYIQTQHLPPATEEKRIEQVKRQELVVWKIRQISGFNGQEGEVFTLDNGVDAHQYAISTGGQSFGMFAEKTTTSFSFSAGANPSHGRMTGTWTTPAGSTKYDMDTGDAIQVKVH